MARIWNKHRQTNLPLKKKIFVGLSGGVDSSVAVYLLLKKGYDVVGVHLRCWNVGGCDVREAEDARRVADKLNIPFYVFDMEKEYKAKVVEYMIDGYRRGITPNPDVICNKEIKFGLFMTKALAMGADFVATGHYVSLSKNHSGYSLFEAKDKNKDQSYFLWTLTQRQLEHVLFPIGAYLKPKVRELARRAGLPTADKKDSQGICFIGNVSLTDFLSKYIPESKGAVLNTKGEKVGEHEGVQFYTVGQRHIGVNIEKQRHGTSGHNLPTYVVSKDAGTNVLTVAEGEDNPALYRSGVNLFGVNLINVGVSQVMGRDLSVLARVRYRQPLFKARLAVESGGKATLAFGKPQKFIAPGQSAVFYRRNGEMIGGGVIADSF